MVRAQPEILVCREVAAFIEFVRVVPFQAVLVTIVCELFERTRLIKRTVIVEHAVEKVVSIVFHDIGIRVSDAKSRHHSSQVSVEALYKLSHFLDMLSLVSDFESHR